MFQFSGRNDFRSGNRLLFKRYAKTLDLFVTRTILEKKNLFSILKGGRMKESMV